MKEDENMEYIDIEIRADRWEEYQDLLRELAEEDEEEGR